jgi:ribose-phosphate pyrophosphokinase
MTGGKVNAEEIKVFAGSGSRQLTQRICDVLGVAPGQNETITFSEGNTFVRILENVRGRRVYLVQSMVFPTNDNFVELLFWLDAFRRASARAITAVIPYFSYAKGDKKDEPRVSIRARVCADAIEIAGATRVLTLDLHSPQIQGFFRLPVDNLFALPVFCERLKAMSLDNVVIVAPDAGYVKQARRFARALGAPVAIADKERSGHGETSTIIEIVGDVRGKTAVIVDDFTISAGTLANVAVEVARRGAANVYGMVTHAVLTPGSIERIDASPLQKLFVTDSVENQPVTFSEKIEVISVAPLLAQAIRRIHEEESVSEMPNP